MMSYHAPVNADVGILVVNSNAAVRRMLESHLQRVSHRVVGCGTVSEAQGLLEEGQWSLLLIDSDLSLLARIAGM